VKREYQDHSGGKAALMLKQSTGNNLEELADHLGTQSEPNPEANDKN